MGVRVMLVTINKKRTQIEEGTTVGQLLKARKLHKAAVWVNGGQLLAADYETYQLQEGDDIKLLRRMAGG